MSGVGNVLRAVHSTVEKCGPSRLQLLRATEASPVFYFDFPSLIEPTEWHGGQVPVRWHTAMFAFQERGASVRLWLHRQGRDAGMDNDALWEGGLLWDRARDKGRMGRNLISAWLHVGSFEMPAARVSVARRLACLECHGSKAGHHGPPCQPGICH